MKVIEAIVAAGCVAALVIGSGGDAALGQSSPQPRAGAGQSAPAQEALPRRVEPRADKREGAPKPEVDIEESPDAVEGCPFHERKLELIV
jgi:hypothetical protein